MKADLALRFSLVALLTFLAGCSTVERRAGEHARMLASLPPDVKQNVREGKIDIGYTTDLVYVALGSPDRVYSRRTAESETVVWVYTKREPAFDRAWGAGFWGWYGPAGFHGEGSREYEALRVEFRAGKVHAIERIKR